MLYTYVHVNTYNNIFIYITLCDSPAGQSKWSDGEEEYSSTSDVGSTGLHQLASAAASASASASAASKDQQQQQPSELQQLALTGSSTGSAASGGESEGVSLRQLR
jgi:hypothetical protein